MSKEPKPVVLVLDDEREILVALQDLLEPEHRVVPFADPAAALQHLQDHRDVAVIMSDQRMPAMSGNRFLAAARELSDAEAILLTGYADMEAVIAAINDGKVTGYVHKPWDNADLLSMVRLAAERHRTRRALDLERRLFDGLLAGATDAIRLFDSKGVVLRSNRNDGQTLDEADRAALASGTASVEEVQTDESWFRIQRIPLDQPSGERLLLRIEGDLTRERQLERRLRQAEKLEALGTLAGGIAHDFNNLLTAVIGNLELAARRPDNPKVPRFVDGALEAARRGASLTGRLLSFSRQSGGNVRAVDVREVIEGMADLLGRTLGGGISVRLDPCEPDLVVRADPDQLALAILNLCVNARDAMTGLGTITIRCSLAQLGVDDQLSELRPGDYVRIAVTDTGSGMSPETIARAFDPFFTTKPVGKGTGLGLSMVYGFAKGLGGTVQVDSAEGRGTTISVLLPRSRDADRAQPLPRPAPQTGRFTVLLVEDDPAVREVTRRHLEELGHEVLEADLPATALAFLDAGRAVDLVVTDFAMPGVSGLDFVAAARERRPELPALLLTGFAERADVPASVHRLAKPFSADGLARALGETMAQQAPANE